MAYVNQQFFGAVTADDIIKENLIVITGSITTNSNTITNASALNTYDFNLLRVSQSVYSLSNGITSSAYITNISGSTITLSKTSSLTQGDTIGFSTPPGTYFFKSASFTDPNNLITVNDISGSDFGKDYAVVAQAQRDNSLITGRFHLYKISEVTHRSAADSHLSFFVEWGEPYTEAESGDIIRLDGKNLAIVDLTDLSSLSPEFSREIPGMENIPIGSDSAAWNIALNNYLEALETSFTPIADFNSFTSSYNTGSFTGSFIGSGAGLYNISASGIIGLNLSQISSGSVSASISPQNGLQVNTNVTATSFTGSFSGSGENLYNIPASGITGLNLSQISSGSVSASISPDSGVQINTNVTATSFTGSLFGTASYAQTASVAPNYLPLTGGTIAGSLIVQNNLTVLGSASIQYISESTLNIGTNLITVNTFNPSIRFGGLAVIDSGSSPTVSASFLYDSLQDEFIFVHKGTSTSAITSSHFILGPETYNDMGNELYISQNRLPKGVGNEHLNDSNITDDGTVVSINSNTQVTGSLTVTEGITGSLFGTASHAINQLVTSSLIDSYIGTRIFPTSTTSNGFAVDRDVNGAVGLVIRNSDTSGNGAYSAVSLSPSGSWYNSGTSLIYFNDGYYVTSLRNTGGIFSSVNSNILLLNNKDFSVQTGATLTTLSTKFKVSGSGNVYIPLGDLEITGSLRVSGSITGSLFGTASYALNGLSSSYSINSTSASYAVTASFIDGGYY